jgi:hypothetical protein
VEKSWGVLTETWTPDDTQDQVVHFIHKWEAPNAPACLSCKLLAGPASPARVLQLADQILEGQRVQFMDAARPLDRCLEAE